MIRVADSLGSIVAAGALAFEGLRVAAIEPRLDGPLAGAEAQARLGAERDLGAVRRMYSRVGLDPTRRRPSSEALLRRVRRGDSLPRINALVDVCNWCSLEFLVPYGLYDLDRIDGPVQLRLGLPGESYAGIRKDAVHVEGRLTLADARGAFGNPSSDSARTMVTEATVRALVVAFVPRESAAVLDRLLTVTAARVLAYAGGREAGRAVV